MDGTVSCRIDVTIVFHVILHVIAIPKAIPGASQYVLHKANVNPSAPKNRSKGISTPRRNFFSKGTAIKLPKSPPIPIKV